MPRTKGVKPKKVWAAGITPSRRYFYRVEDANHQGPYTRTNRAIEWPPSTMMCGDNHKTPYNDPKLHEAWDNLERLGIHRSYRFGFVSLKAVHEWFNTADQAEWLIKYSYHVAIYTVMGPVLEGEVQAICREDDLVFRRFLSQEEGGF